MGYISMIRWLPSFAKPLYVLFEPLLIQPGERLGVPSRPSGWTVLLWSYIRYFQNYGARHIFWRRLLEELKVREWNSVAQFGSKFWSKHCWTWKSHRDLNMKAAHRQLSSTVVDMSPLITESQHWKLHILQVFYGEAAFRIAICRL